MRADKGVLVVGSLDVDMPVYKEAMPQDEAIRFANPAAPCGDVGGAAERSDVPGGSRTDRRIKVPHGTGEKWLFVRECPDGGV